MRITNLLLLLSSVADATFISNGNLQKQHEVHTKLYDTRPPSPSSSSSSSSSRRNFLLGSISTATATSLLIQPIQPAYAGEVGARITKAVTTSDLGISVRRSVVKGAQIIDELDGKWEKFSDDNGLGSERYKQQPRPTPREIPDPLPLKSDIATNVLKIADETFIKTLNDCNANNNNDNDSSLGRRLFTLNDLEKQIQKVDSLVRKSFERSGLDLSSETVALTGPQFNYYCYIHYKAMCDILIENKLSFNRKKFESNLGESILPFFVTTTTATTTSFKNTPMTSQEKAIENSLSMTDEILNNLVQFGFCSIAERNPIEKEEGKIADWIDDLTDLQLSIPLDGDVTLSSQLLLQEQGFRLYPSFGKAVITTALQKGLSGTKQNVNSDEYYMDTNYSSDPNLFEVKQVLLNIVIDS